MLKHIWKTMRKTLKSYICKISKKKKYIRMTNYFIYFHKNYRFYVSKKQRIKILNNSKLV